MAKRWRVAVVIPARNAAEAIGPLAQAVRAQAEAARTLEVLVVDDGSSDGTAQRAEAAGARVVARADDGGNPAAARNLGAAQAAGDVVVFLDADCMPGPGWLAALLRAHDAGEVCVGGSLALPAGLPATARWDYFAGWYHVHPRRQAGAVPHHPPCNLSIRRDLFATLGGFTEEQPIAYAHEELRWQAALQARGARIWFEPAAVVTHANRPGWGNLLRRTWRWAFCAVESKAASGIARHGWRYRHPLIAAVTAIPLAPLEAGYIVACWLRAGLLEPLVIAPVVLWLRLVYAAGLAAGALRWWWRGCPVPRSAGAQVAAPELTLTVVICTHRRPAEALRAVQSLLAQEQAPEEILVVDNAPDDDATRRLLAPHAARVRCVVEPRRGLDIARNRALREARGALVAFLDDDAVADRRWAAAWRECFASDPRVALCTGRVEALTLETPAQRLFEANGGYARGAARIRLPEDGAGRLHGRRAPLIAWAVSIGNGTSFAVRRDVVRQLGGFDEALDRGEPLPGGGDLDLFWRVLRAGHRVVYEPAVLAWHEHRRELEAVGRQLAGHQRALVAFLMKSLRASRGGERARVALFLGWRLLKPGARLVARAARRDPLPAGLLWRMWGASWQGLTALNGYAAASMAAALQEAP